MKIAIPISQYLDKKILLISALFGFAGFAVIYFELFFVIPGSLLLTDLREVFVIIGSAITGPVGSIIVAILACLYEPTPEIQFYVMAQHVFAAITTSLLYKKYFGKNLSSVEFVFRWVLLVGYYYYIAYIPILTIVYLFFPEFNLPFLKSGMGYINSFLYLYAGWSKEIIITLIITLLSMYALPMRYKKPLWVKGEWKTVKSKEKSIEQTSLSFRLSLWFFLLSVLPILLGSFFLKQEIFDYFLKTEATQRYDFAQQTALILGIKGKPSEDISQILLKGNRNVKLILMSFDGRVAVSSGNIKAGASASEYFPIAVIKEILEKKNGTTIDQINYRSYGYTTVEGAPLIVVSYSIEATKSDLIVALTTRTNLLYLTIMLVVAVVAGFLLWVLVGVPMRKLVKAAEKFGAGRYDTRIDCEPLDDEVKLFASTFNTMAKNVQDSDSSLRFEVEERIVAEQRIADSETKFRALIEQSVDGIALIDSKGIILEWNSRMELITSVKRSEVIGKSQQQLWELFVHYNGVDLISFSTISGTIGNILKNKGGISGGVFFDLQLKKSNSFEYFTVLELFPVEFANGFNVGLQLRDVTPSKKLELQLKNALHKAEEINKLKTNILSNLSHEFRTPLNGIIGFSTILIDEINDNEQNEMMKKIASSGDRLMSTLNSLLVYSELESASIVPHLKVQNVKNIIDTLSITFRDRIERKGLSYFTEISYDKTVLCDESLLKLIIGQLVDNAIKFTDVGAISLRVYETQKQNGEFIAFSVTDTGIGIPEQKIEMIFEEFRQAAEGYNRPFEGSGLGLSIVKRLAELMNGKVSVVSTLGNGAEFIVELPK